MSLFGIKISQISQNTLAFRNGWTDVGYVLMIKILMLKVIQGKDKTNINTLIVIDCTANIFTVIVHTFNQAPFFKLRLFSKY